MILEIKNLTKKYKDKIAVNNFSIQLNEGIYGFLGPNGAGKSTLMKMLADTLKPTSGHISINGEDKNNLDERYRELLGYLPQDIGFYTNFTLEKFLFYVSSLKGMNKYEGVKKTEEVLKLVNLYENRRKKISTLSGGMKQRLGIAQALLNDPKILILDEPTVGLDPKERIRFRNIISNLAKNKIIILSTHIVSDVEFIAKEVILINNGQLLDFKTSKELINDLKGLVWKVVVSEDKLESIKNNFIIGNIVRVDNKVEIRVISEEKPLQNAEEIYPCFEDVYLYHFEEISEE